MNDKSEPGLIATAQAHIETNRTDLAFFCLALEAIRQLTRIADANEKIAAQINNWDRGGMLDVMAHKAGEF